MKKIVKHALLFFWVSAGMFAATSVSAQPAAITHKKESMLAVTGTVPVRIKLQNGEEKTIRLLNIKLSPRAKAMLAYNLSFALLPHSVQPAATNTLLPPAVETGMNGVPVLDQGLSGTCVTFANTAAIDAFYPLRGDQQASQLCSLALGRTLQIPDADGGWTGSSGAIVLNEISQYGYIPLAWQKANGCGGLKEYPMSAMHMNYRGTPMPVNTYTQNSIKTFTASNWSTLLSMDSNNLFKSDEKEKLLATVKENLVAGYRVTIGFILDEANTGGVAGAMGSWKNNFDTWVLTPEIIEHINKGYTSGHEIIITGYDDNACASYLDNDRQSKKQCGLLRLRNSWGKLAGDEGDFYMSYDYFRNLVGEAYLIGKGGGRRT